MNTLEQEEREYWGSFMAAQNHGYPYGFSEFCRDFDNMITVSKCNQRIDDERDKRVTS